MMLGIHIYLDFCIMKHVHLFSASCEISHLLWNLTAHYHIHKNALLDSII